MKRIFICLLVFVANQVYSQWSTSPYDNLQVAQHGGNIHVVSDGNGGAIVAYNNFDYEVTTTYLQWVDKYGYLKWNEPMVIADGPGIKNYIQDIFHNSDGTILIGYTSGYTYVDPVPRFEYDPYVQKLDSNGNRLWGENGIRLRADSIGKNITGIDFCYDGDGGLFASWNFNYEVNYPPYFYDSLFIQHISKDGDRLWGDNGILVDDNLIDVLDGWIVNDDSGGIFMQYYKQTNVYLVKNFDSTGNLNWTLSLPINFSRAIKDGNVGIIISGVVDTYPANTLIISRISLEGEKLWGEGVIFDDSVNNSIRYPAEIFLNPDSTITVFWDTEWWPNDELFLQRYTIEGEKIWEEPIKVSDFTSPKGRAGIINSDDNANIIVWGETRDSSAIYAQKIDVLGNKLWVNNDILIMSHSPYDETKVITDGNDGAIVVWRIDPPWGGVYAQQISKYGNLGEIIITVSEDNGNDYPAKYYLAQNYPNPFNPITKIKYSISQPSFVVLKVYDILGNEIETLVNEEQPSGFYEVEFDAASISSGVYFYQLQAGDFISTKRLVLLK